MTMTGGAIAAGGALIAFIVTTADSLSGLCIGSCTDTTQDGNLLGIGLEVAFAIGVVSLIAARPARRFPPILMALEWLATIGIAVATVLIAADGADVHFSTDGTETSRSSVVFIYPLLLIADALFVAAFMRDPQHR